MNNEYLINSNSSLITALKKINALPKLQTVFAIDENSKLVGILTDGDIRRGLIRGLSVDSPLDQFYQKHFKSLVAGEDNFSKLKEFREMKLKAVPLLNKEGQILKIYNFEEIKSILPIDAVIMAGGKGTRLLPLTKEIPKPLLKVGSKEIISYNFKRLHQFGITNQHITVNYLKEKITDFCDQYELNIKFNIVNEPTMLGTAGALSLIDSFDNDTVLLMNSDLLTNIDYEDLYKFFIDSKADMVVASMPYEVNLPYAIFEFDENKVKSLKEKPNYTYFANAGIYLFKKELIDLIPSNEVYNATDFMEDIIALGKTLKHYPIRGYWLDIGKHKDFEKAQKDIAHINWD